MSETPVPSIYETTFAKTDKTDAILVVDGKKLHVNKAVLSYHSIHFEVMFYSDFEEKSMPEFEIKEVEFEDFATLLSLVHEKPIMPTIENAERILELSKKFLLFSVRNVVEMFLISTTEQLSVQSRIGEKYRDARTERDDRKMEDSRRYFDYIETEGYHDYEEIDDTFAKTRKTDAILVVKGKKLHVNKAILSYHSDYFNNLFNSDSEEKSMPEFEIKDVKFEELAALLSLVTVKPIEPFYNNCRRLLDLSILFSMPSVKFTIENYLASLPISFYDKFDIAEEYNLENLMNFVLHYNSTKPSIMRMMCKLKQEEKRERGYY